MRSALCILVTALIAATQVVSAADRDAIAVVSEESPPAGTDGQIPGTDAAAVATRNAALDLANAFSNDGYKTRDGYLTQVITPAIPIVVEVNLFMGNEYWFCTAITPQSTDRIRLAVFDSDGRIVNQQLFDDGARFASGFEPSKSGSYYIRVSLEGKMPAFMSLVYCYK